MMPEVANVRANQLNHDIDTAHLHAEQAIRQDLNNARNFHVITHRAGFVGEAGVYVSCLVEYTLLGRTGSYLVERARVDFDEQMKVVGITSITLPTPQHEPLLM